MTKTVDNGTLSDYDTDNQKVGVFEWDVRNLQGS